ncbi:hypothetical protein QG37_08134 [Candidozyma auris]|nr:hypothetical protein QG37_08134 [[Candida] auris]
MYRGCSANKSVEGLINSGCWTCSFVWEKKDEEECFGYDLWERSSQVRSRPTVLTKIAAPIKKAPQ